MSDSWDGMPRTCTRCNGTLRITKDTIWFDTFAWLSWHMDCRLQAVPSNQSNQEAERVRDGSPTARPAGTGRGER